MAEKGFRQNAAQERSSRRIRDIPLLIKIILLVLLILLLIGQVASGEFSRQAEPNWLHWVILVVKLVLIVLLIVLILVQRCLKCEITEPSGCTEEEPDPVAGKLIVRIRGTASGAAFGSYVLEVRQGGGPPIPGIISYPGGGGSGSAPVINGELGQMDTTSLSDGGYEVTLRVYPAGPGTPKACTKSFSLLKTIAYISRVAEIPAISMAPIVGNANPFDEAAELRLDVAPAYVPRSVGGRMSMEGSAYVYECPGRKIKKYEIRYAHVLTPGAEPAQPAMDAPIPPAFSHVIPPLPLEYASADHYQPWTRVGPAPTDLVNSWKTFTIGASTYFKLKAGEWTSTLSGRYSLLLSVEDTAGHLYHDIQHIWLDNKDIIGRIVKFQWKNPETDAWEDIPVCQDLSMKQFGKIRIVGLAWDPPIDDAWWPAAAPNDNFGHYELTFKKQFGVYQPLTGTIPNRVPALPAVAPVPTPTDADAAELAIWDLTALDAGPIPSPYTPPPDPLIYRKESCTYIVRLYVTDTTVVNESTTHHRWHHVPIKVVNDL